MFTKNPISALRATITTLRHGEQLKKIPDRLESLLRAYDNIHTNEEFRRDIFTMLDHCFNLAEALISPTYNARSATQDAAHLIAVVGKVTYIIQERPTAPGWALFFPDTGEFHLQIFGSKEEATSFKGNPLFRNQNCLVLPVSLQSETGWKLPPTGGQAETDQALSPPPPLPVSDSEME